VKKHPGVEQSTPGFSFEQGRVSELRQVCCRAHACFSINGSKRSYPQPGAHGTSQTFVTSVVSFNR
jgi:hypothetical protein